MKTSIKVNKISKHFKIQKKESGLRGSLKGFYNRKYKTIKAVDDVSFDIEQGELVGFIGPNGAGKTTTLKILSGLLYPSFGEVEVLGFKPYERHSDYLRNISLIMGQKNQLWWDLPPVETFKLNKEIYDISEKDYQEITTELIDLLDVKDILDQQVRRLSLGQRMKCELIAALLHKPTILFLDEPTIGLDLVTQKKIRKFIKEYNKRYNATVMLTSHYMDDVSEVCNRIIFINKGKIVFDGHLKGLIQKHADYKLISIIFMKEITIQQLNDLKSFGEVISKRNKLKVTIKVAREDTTKIAAKIIENYPVDDLDIAEPRLEDILEESFH